MSYDHWKTTEPDDGAEKPLESNLDDALEAKDAELALLRASHDRLLAAALAKIERLEAQSARLASHDRLLAAARHFLNEQTEEQAGELQAAIAAAEAMSEDRNAA